MSSSEALFSLEVVVDRLYILPTLTCRFPSIALRLLDFPAFTIDHIDAEDVSKLRDKLTIDPSYEIAPQLRELKDRDGFFSMCKGKSCLCRVSPDELRMHLANSPLYALVLDTFTNPPRLVGNATLPLTAAIEQISDELLKDGISVPATFGEKRILKVFNLMGTEIGHLSLGYRLTSLGAVLLSHIPVQSLLSSKSIGGSLNIPDEGDRGFKGMYTHEDMSGSIQTVSRGPQVCLKYGTDFTANEAPTLTANATNGTAQKMVASNSTQTQLYHPMADQLDYMVNNVFCPPPLYYNSLSEPASGPLALPAAGVTDSPSSSDGSGFLDETRVQKVAATKAVHASDQVRNDAGKQQSEQCSHTRASQTESGLCSCTARQSSVGLNRELPELRARFPVLGALVAELLCGLKDSSLGRTASSSSDVRWGLLSQAVGAPDEPLVCDNEAQEVNAGSKTLGVGFHAGTMVNSISKTRVIDKSLACRRKQAQTAGKLTYGFTRTQKLRLSKTNPDALRRLEAKESARGRTTMVRPTTAPPSVMTGEQLFRTRMDDVVTALQVAEGKLSAVEPDEPRHEEVASGTPRRQDVVERALSTVSLMASQMEDESQLATLGSRKSIDVRLPSVQTSDIPDTDGATSRSSGSSVWSGHDPNRHNVMGDLGSTVAEYRLAMSRALALPTSAPTFSAKIMMGLKDEEFLIGHSSVTDVHPGTGNIGDSSTTSEGLISGSRDDEAPEMSKITEQSEPEEESYSDSFDSDISKSISLPVTVEHSEADSSLRMRPVEAYAVLPRPLASAVSPTPKGRPTNATPNRERSSGNQDGKPPLSSRSRGAHSSSETQPLGNSRSRGGGASSADSKASLNRVSDGSGRSAHGEGGKKTSDAGDSEGSYRAMRAHNEERRQRLSRIYKDDLNTDSVSSYDPSEAGGADTNSQAGSDDLTISSEARGAQLMTLSRLAPVNKLGYTT